MIFPQVDSDDPDGSEKDLSKSVNKSVGRAWTSMLPLVLGLPFAPELREDLPHFWRLPEANEGSVAQTALTLVANFAHSG